MDKTKISIIYDNQLHDKGLQSGWGFSCLVEHSGKKILFDTGDNAEKLESNLKNLQINPQDFEAIVLSHNHWDHTGGLNAIVGKSKTCKLYFGKSYPANFQDRMKLQGVNFILVEDVRKIFEGIFAGPEMGALGLKEIPLTVQTDKGLVIITGCAHPGIVNMIKKIKEELDKDIYLVLGGFHLGMSFGLNSIVEDFKKLGVKKAGPCHCSGARAINLFKKRFKEDFIRVGAGLTIEI